MNKKILSITAAIAAALLVFSFTVSCKKQPAAEASKPVEATNSEETKAEEKSAPSSDEKRSRVCVWHYDGNIAERL